MTERTEAMPTDLISDQRCYPTTKAYLKLVRESISKLSDLNSLFEYHERRYLITNRFS